MNNIITLGGESKWGLVFSTNCHCILLIHKAYNEIHRHTDFFNFIWVSLYLGILDKIFFSHYLPIIIGYISNTIYMGLDNKYG